MNNQTLLELLNQLTDELKRSHLWSESDPKPNQLMSQEPFAVDVMDFEQWLQWLFIPRLINLAKEQKKISLVHKSDISSMAEYVFLSYSQPTEMIVSLLKRIDNSLN